MTRNQIEKRRSELRHLDTKEANREEKELDCRSMINSCLCYGSNFYEKIYRWVYSVGYANQSYADDFIKALGEETVARLYKEQTEDFNKATVLTNTYTDSEGLSYNSIIWEDEKAI